MFTLLHHVVWLAGLNCVVQHEITDGPWIAMVEIF